MNESAFKQRVIDKAKLNGFYAFTLSDKVTKGIPDLVVMKNGHTVWVECKVFMVPANPNIVVDQWAMVQLPSNIFSKSPMQFQTMKTISKFGSAKYVVGIIERGAKDRLIGVCIVEPPFDGLTCKLYKIEDLFHGRS